MVTGCPDFGMAHQVLLLETTLGSQGPARHTMGQIGFFQQIAKVLTGVTAYFAARVAAFQIA